MSTYMKCTLKHINLFFKPTQDDKDRKSPEGSNSIKNYFVQARTRNNMSTDVQEEIEDVDEEIEVRDNECETTYGLGLAKGTSSSSDDDSLTQNVSNKKARTDDETDVSKGNYHYQFDLSFIF